MSRKLEVCYLPIEEINPYLNNARTHSRSQIQQIANSIRKFGYLSPILIDENNSIIAGHGRALAAREIGLEVIPAIRADHLTPAQVRAYRLADNKIAANAGWDDDILKIELDALTSVDIDFDVDLIGFSTTEVDLILGNDVVPSSDDEIIPTPSPGNAVSRPGDIFCLRTHRVIVGDCRNPDVIDQLMDGAQARVVISDPPYNVRVAGHISGLGKNQHREFIMASGEMTSEEFTQFLSDALAQFSRVSVDGSLHYIFMDWRHMAELLAAGEAVYDRQVNLCVWCKSNSGMGSLYRSQHELIFIFKKGSASHINNVQLGANGRHRSNIWQYQGVNTFSQDRDEALRAHPTVKPVAMLSDAILDVTRHGDVVLDGFLGSGSCLIAAERTSRICYGVELDPGYVDVTIDRWQRITGELAILAGTERDIDQLAAERGVDREVAA